MVQPLRRPRVRPARLGSGRVGSGSVSLPPCFIMLKGEYLLFSLSLSVHPLRRKESGYWIYRAWLGVRRTVAHAKRGGGGGVLFAHNVLAYAGERN